MGADDAAVACVDRILATLGEAHRSNRLVAQQFDGAEPVTVGFIETMKPERQSLLGDVLPSDVERPFAYKAIGNFNGHEAPDEWNCLIGLSIRSVTPEDVWREKLLPKRFVKAGFRDKVPRRGDPTPLLAYNVCALGGGRTDPTLRKPILFDMPTLHDVRVVCGGDYLHYSEGRFFDRGPGTREGMLFHLLYAANRAFCRRYEWSVLLSQDGAPAISFQTDPIGAREAFRLRDIPNGASRRAALLHWVKEHWRKKRSDSAEETRVRAHLRGQEEFVWNGLHCRIKASQYDREIARRDDPKSTGCAARQGFHSEGAS
jgi:hypothetical protein